MHGLFVQTKFDELGDFSLVAVVVGNHGYALPRFIAPDRNSLKIVVFAATPCPKYLVDIWCVHLQAPNPVLPPEAQN